ncbi:MAG: hypothetical protein AAF065_01775 [Verrucomicrobiota bacterium]
MRISYPILALVAAIVTPLGAVDMQQLVQDTQRFSQEARVTKMVWWIPSEFWEVTLEQDPSLTEQQKKEFVAALDDYTAFVVTHSTIGTFGGMTNTGRKEIEENIALVVEGNQMLPLTDDEMSPDASAFYAMMKPMMAQMLGQFGQGMEFFIYSNKSKGKLIIDPKKEGTFYFKCFGDKYDWRLPLGSLLPPKLDSDTGETFPGNYMFNPFTGSELTVK